MRRTRVSNPERKAMRELRLAGMLIRDIARRFPQWAYSTVRAHVRDIEPDARWRRISPDDRAAMRQMRRDGRTLDAINIEFSHLHYLTIQRIVRDVTPERRPIRNDRKVDPVAAMRLRDEHGMMWKAIGARFGVTAAAACQAARQAREARS